MSSNSPASPQRALRGPGRGLRIVRRVATSASSTVFELADLRGRRFALKLVSGEGSGEARSRFESELSALRRIHSPHVVRVIDGFVRPGPIYALLEPWLEGPTLREVLARRGRLQPAEATRVVIEVLRGLEAIHAVGLLHRDVCASNVLLARDAGELGGVERAVLVDLGLALEQGEGPTPGHVRCRPGSVAPEQILGGALDARTDVYAVGCLLHELLTGRPPFVAPSVSATLALHLERLPSLPGRHDPVLAPFDGIVDTALAKRPDRRYGSAREMAEALARLERADTGAPRAASVEVRP
jgi:serine/threonine-protein kinase